MTDAWSCDVQSQRFCGAVTTYEALRQQRQEVCLSLAYWVTASLLGPSHIYLLRRRESAKMVEEDVLSTKSLLALEFFPFFWACFPRALAEAGEQGCSLQAGFL